MIHFGVSVQLFSAAEALRVMSRQFREFVLQGFHGRVCPMTFKTLVAPDISDLQDSAI